MNQEFEINNGILLKYNGNSKEIYIPEGVVEIDSNAFFGAHFESVSFPSTLKKVGDYAFHSCRDLKKIDFGDSVESLGFQCFDCCSSLESVKFPDSLKELGDGVFSYCGNLRSVEFGKGLVSLPEECFSNTGLKEINIPEGVSKFGIGVFYNCKELENVNLPKTLSRIPASSFEKCEIIKEFDCKDVKCIDHFAFYGCHNLETFKSNDSAIRVHKGVFLDCPKLENTTLPTLNIFEDTFVGLNKNYEGDVVLPDNVKIIGDLAFSHSNVKRVVINNDVSLLGESFTYSNVEEILGNSKMMVGTEDFFGCQKLKTVQPVIDCCDNSISGVFLNCKQLRSVSLVNVVDLGDNFFGSCDNLESVKILDSDHNKINKIGNGSFGDCLSLKEFSYSDGESVFPKVKEFGFNSFFNCQSLSGDIDLSNAKSLAKYSFWCCYKANFVNLCEDIRYKDDIGFTTKERVFSEKSRVDFKNGNDLNVQFKAEQPLDEYFSEKGRLDKGHKL